VRVALVSRYPRADVPAWKRTLAQGLLESGFELSVVYSRSSLADQLLAGVREFGPRSVVGKALSIRRGNGGATGEPSAQTLAAWAEERGLPVLRCARLGDADCVAALTEARPDLLVLAGSDLVPANVLAIPARGTINAHYGLLPRYRGMNVTEWSIYHDDPIGVTVHMVDPGVDTGDIVVQEEIAAEPGDTLETLRGKHQELAAMLLLEAARRISDGSAAPRPQQPEDGRQFYRMHPAVRAVVEGKLAAGSYRPSASVAAASASPSAT
jgi:folate-dependent phosphoribosylglycinamide formyltransferase PurN